jgi:hypothetical protein
MVGPYLIRGYGSLAVLLVTGNQSFPAGWANRWPIVPEVQDPDSSPRAFRPAGGRSWSFDEWQNRYSYETVRIATGFGSVIIGLKASIIRSQNPVVVLIV